MRMTPSQQNQTPKPRKLLQVGQAMVVCKMTVLTAQAYAAMTNGTCSPACTSSLPCPKVRSTYPLWQTHHPLRML